MIILKFRAKILVPRCVSLYSTPTSSVKTTVFKNTVFLPKTSFPTYVNNPPERDRIIRKAAHFDDYYEWQRDYGKGDEFVLHDGPPYANGSPHMGHAINKILKDIILRSQIVQGKKVHFVPGWDCHGLPIELVALKNSSVKTVKEIRQKSKDIAFKYIKIQKEAFKKWGVMGNWDKYYYTCSPEYVKNELQLFWKLYEKGYVFHALKPVYWSPSSGTALAESELEYNENHVSPSVVIRFKTVDDSNNEPLYLLVWTTTPWTLPSNGAVMYNKQFDYSIVKLDSLPGSYIIASSLLEDNKIMNREISHVRSISHDELNNLKYYHPWWTDRIMKVYESSEVKKVATGLLHTSPAHGHTDFLFGRKQNLPVECYVDEKGCFTREVGEDLAGLSVLDEGSDRVMEKLESEIVIKDTIVHSYPYDWRTGKPVIIRASKQWFIDINRLTNKVLKHLENIEIPLDHFKTYFKTRPFWCLSRQRVWGVPIPVFIVKKTGKAIITKETVDHICDLILTQGIDCWWNLPMRDLIPSSVLREFHVTLDDIERGQDIMDVWFDSGVSWSYVLEGKTADVCLEGIDQFRGWFQSLMLTSVAAEDKAPYKKLLIHSSAVDDDGKKMSKSVGNVFDPMVVVEGKNALGVDVLRWWVASHTNQPKASVSMNRMENTSNDLKKIRQSLRFLIGCLNGLKNDDIQKLSPSSLLDIYCLNSSYNTYHLIMKCYNEYNFYGVTSNLLHYISIISSLYITSVKDRLYCDQLNTKRRGSCLYTLCGILDTISHCLAPILPHLAEEIQQYNPLKTGTSFFYNQNMWKPPTQWMNESATEVINLANEIKQEILAQTPKPEEVSCLVEIGEQEYNLLKEINGKEEESCDSELTEILRVASVSLKVGERKVTLEKTKKEKCERCYRYTAEIAGLCLRCDKFINGMIYRKFQEL